MRILGISNPSFMGVTVATKAICTDWLPGPHMKNPYERQNLESTIFHYGPDLFVVGGWSEGYTELLTSLRRNGNKSFPILCVIHSTPFHGTFFHSDWAMPEFEVAREVGLVDLLGFVHPQTADYYQSCRKQFAAFVPHAFKPVVGKTWPNSDPTFRIGVLGDWKHWHKNAQGSLLVAREFAKHHRNVEVIMHESDTKPRDAFLATLSQCSVIIHASHLECYSNTIQEAWSQGVPAITSPANDGLTVDNPILSEEMKTAASRLRMTSGIEARQMYELLEMVKANKDFFSKEAFKISHELYKRTHIYNNALFKSIIDGFEDKEHDVGLFEAPFHGGIDWERLSKNL